MRYFNQNVHIADYYGEVIRIIKNNLNLWAPYSRHYSAFRFGNRFFLSAFPVQSFEIKPLVIEANGLWTRHSFLTRKASACCTLPSPLLLMKRCSTCCEWTLRLPWIPSHLFLLSWAIDTIYVWWWWCARLCVCSISSSSSLQNSCTVINAQ